MNEERRCMACGARLVGPMGPRITLAGLVDEQEVELPASAWMCATCGLVHWYGDGESLPTLREVADGVGEYNGTPGTSYARRTQVFQVLRRMRRL